MERDMEVIELKAEELACAVAAALQNASEAGRLKPASMQLILDAFVEQLSTSIGLTIFFIKNFERTEHGQSDQGRNA